jgi:hypothetical protein
MPAPTKRYGNEGGCPEMTLHGTADELPVESIFTCRICDRVLLLEDIFNQGLRQPEPGETRDEYMEAELLDGLDHLVCLRERAPNQAF